MAAMPHNFAGPNKSIQLANEAIYWSSLHGHGWLITNLCQGYNARTREQHVHGYSQDSFPLLPLKDGKELFTRSLSTEGDRVYKWKICLSVIISRF